MLTQTFDLAALAHSPWKNGGGTTREIVRWPAGSTLEDFEWRVSVATLSASGPFSVLPDVDRQIMLLNGDGARLRSNDGSIDHALSERWKVFAFRGETAIDAVLMGDTSTDFNLMVRRGHWHGQMQVVRQARHTGSAPAGVCMVLAGRWRRAGEVLTAGQGLWWTSEGHEGDEGAMIEPLPGDGEAAPALAWVVLEQVPPASRAEAGNAAALGIGPGRLSLTSKNNSLAHPAGVDSLPTSASQEDRVRRC